jgi:transposase-like protein
MRGEAADHPQAGVDYPGTWAAFLKWFPDDPSCVEFLVGLRWPNGFVCPLCGSAVGWRGADGRFSCSGCASKVSVTSGTIFHGTRTPLTSWFAAAWYMTSQKNGASALGLQRILGLGSYRTAWTMLHKLRTAMIRPDRDMLSGDVEVDETYLGGIETGRRGGRQRDSIKEIVVIGVEVHSPKGFGRVRLRSVEDLSAASLVGFICDVVAPGSVIITDGWNSYLPLPRHGYTHKRTSIRAGDDPAHVVQPGVHRVASLLKRWLMGTHQGAIRPEHLDAYLEEFTFRFNRRSSHRPGMLFYRLLEQAVVTDPAPYKDIIGGGLTTEILTQSSELY